MNNMNDLQKQFKNLIKQGQELLEKMKENQIPDISKKIKRWKPENGDCVWVIYNDGSVEETTYLSDIDEHRLKAGFCFKTKEEAQKELDRRLAEQELLAFCNWDAREPCHIVYCRHLDTFYPALYMSAHCPYRFASEESCQEAINTIGSERLKLIFRID